MNILMKDLRGAPRWYLGEKMKNCRHFAENVSLSPISWMCLQSDQSEVANLVF